ncbi:zinc ABC transporter substrate-binding protein [soil metagenome]
MPNFLHSPLLTAIVAALAIGTASAAPPTTPSVVATTGMIGDIAADVAGPCLEVTTLMGPGVDPHLYRATARDVRTLQGADLVLFHGLDLEGQLGQVLERLGARTPTHAVGEGVTPDAERLTVEGGLIDPHVWMDPTIWGRLPSALAERFAALAPECADDLATRADAATALLHDLDAWIGRVVDTVPPEARVLVTAHDAFGYFARRYGFEVVAIQGISTEAEASVRDVRETADLVVARRIPSVFFETSISPRTVEAVIAAARDRGADVEVGGELYADALGPAGTSAGTYTGMIVHTVATISLGLGGSLPPFDGALAAWAEGRTDLPSAAGRE